MKLSTLLNTKQKRKPSITNANNYQLPSSTINPNTIIKQIKQHSKTPKANSRQASIAQRSNQRTLKSTNQLTITSQTDA